MKIMFGKKFQLVLVAILTLSLVLSGCSASNSQETGKPEQTAQTNDQSAGKISYPEKPINLVIPWAAGGGTDLIFRKLADIMTKDLGQPIVVLNVEGGGGQVGFQQIAAAQADGYTMGVVTNSMLLQKITQGTKLGPQDFSVISMINYDPGTLTVNANSPYKNIKEFIEGAKAAPGKLRMGNSGAKAIWHIAAMLMEKELDVKVTHVPYEGANPAAVAVAGGHIEGVTVSPGEVKGLVDGGKLKILGVMSAERISSFPDVPTFKEEGYDLQFGVWRALVAPKGLPQEIVDRLEASAKKAVESEDFKKFMSENEFGIYHMPSKDAQAYMIKEETTLKEVVGK